MKLYLYSLFFIVVLVNRSKCASIVTADTMALSQDDVLDKTWMSIFGCFQKDEMTSCLQKRAFRALEDWLPNLDSSNDIPKSERKTNEIKEVDVDIEGKLKEMPPMVRSLIDRLGDIIASGIVHFYPDKNVGVESASSDDEDRMAKSTDSDSVQSARGHKKKVKKEIKKAILKLIIFALLIKQKIKMLLMAAQTFLQFKFLLVAIVYVVSNIVKIWLDIKGKHQPQKVIYYENAHHQHHYEPEHNHHEGYDDHHEGWGGLWGRSIVVTESTNSQNVGSNSNSNYFPRSLDLNNQLKQGSDAQDLAYAGQKPSSPVKETQ